jgi:hypothetical protein
MRFDPIDSWIFSALGGPPVAGAPMRVSVADVIKASPQYRHVQPSRLAISA